MSEASPVNKDIALGPESIQEAYDIISAASALGIELPVPIGTIAYEANARSRNLPAKSELVFDQHLGLFSSFESAMVALAGLALKCLDSETTLYMRPWIPRAIAGVNHNVVVTPEENARLKAKWIKGKSLDAIIRSYYADYAVAKRKIEHEPYEYMEVLHKSEKGE
jgi:hypothetical protein